VKVGIRHNPYGVSARIWVSATIPFRVETCMPSDNHETLGDFSPTEAIDIYKTSMLFMTQVLMNVILLQVDATKGNKKQILLAISQVVRAAQKNPNFPGRSPKAIAAITAIVRDATEAMLSRADAEILKRLGDKRH